MRPGSGQLCGHDRGVEASCRHHIALGDLVADLVRHDSRFEIVTPPRFALTCFCLKVSTSSTLLCHSVQTRLQTVPQG